MQRLPLSVHNAYSDLLDRLQDEAVLEIGGTPVQRTIRGRKYWYARSYVGNQEKEKYLGPDAPALRERIERLQQHRYDRREREEGRRSLVQMLRVKGMPRFDAATGKVLQALARIGVFRLRGVLVGTHAFRLYPSILARSSPRRSMPPRISTWRSSMRSPSPSTTRLIRGLRRRSPKLGS